MNAEDIYHGVTGVRDDLIDGAATSKKAALPPKKKRWMGAVAALLAVALVGGLLLHPAGGPLTTQAYAIAQAQYPEMAPYPNEEDYIKPGGEFDDEGFYAAYEPWWADIRARRGIQVEEPDGLENFFAVSGRTFLSGAGTDNRVYSPLNVYMALAMTAELTDGESRQQLLDLLGVQDMETLRRQAGQVWNGNYQNDGATTSILANSLWLNEDVTFVSKTMDTLADTYYASSYRGEMGSEGFNKALQDWLNQQTGGLLKDYADQIELDPGTILALASTLYFKAAWRDEFMPHLTETATFHAPTGDVERDFMRQGGSDTYYWGDNFSAVGKSFTESGKMWFLLPDEGVTPEDLLSDPEAMDFLCSSDRWEWENQKHLIVNKSIPKFDVSSQMELGDGLRAMGVTDILDPAVSDFSPMTKDVEGVFLSQATHAARVTIDEEGCQAAAFTVIDYAGAGAPPDEEVDFVLDRPFLFCVTGLSGLPLFLGIVNQVG